MTNFSRLGKRLQLINFDDEATAITKEAEQASLRNILVDSTVTDWANLGREYRENVQTYNDQMILFAKYIKSLCYHNNVPGLIVHGMPGLGKTYQVLGQLEYVSSRNPEITYKYFKGKITSTQLYINAYLNRNSVIVFDDCDNVFNDVPCMNLLKAMTDTYEKRMVSYASPAIPDNIPSEFEFKGKVIVITNQNVEENPHINALTSRMLPVTVEISPEAVVAKSIDNILNNKQYDRKDSIKIAKFIWTNLPVFDVPTYSLRTSSQLLQIFQLMDYDWNDFIGYSKRFLKQYRWDRLKVTSFSQKKLSFNFDDGQTTGSMNIDIIYDAGDLRYIKADCSHPKLGEFTYYLAITPPEGFIAKKMYAYDTYIVINNNSGNQYIVTNLFDENSNIKSRSNRSTENTDIMNDIRNNYAGTVQFSERLINNFVETTTSRLASLIYDGKLK